MSATAEVIEEETKEKKLKESNQNFKDFLKIIF